MSATEPVLSKRSALRFNIKPRPVKYRLGEATGEATIMNISTGGCSMADTTLGLSLGDRVVFCLDFLGDENNAEIEAVVVRAQENACALQFDITEEFKLKLVKLIALDRRENR